VEDRLARADAFTAGFQDLITRYAWGEIWTRPIFDDRTRRLLVIAQTLAMGRWEEFRLHVSKGLDAGLEAAEIEELLLQSAIYCGVPAANTAFHQADELLRERNTGIA
jgi:alkylhydroperoxidase/carboxymuconolactone decarboxylase family protein YurZ